MENLGWLSQALNAPPIINREADIKFYTGRLGYSLINMYMELEVLGIKDDVLFDYKELKNGDLYFTLFKYGSVYKMKVKGVGSYEFYKGTKLLFWSCDLRTIKDLKNVLENKKNGTFRTNESSRGEG